MKAPLGPSLIKDFTMPHDQAPGPRPAQPSFHERRIFKDGTLFLLDVRCWGISCHSKLVEGVAVVHVM